jgi:cell division protein ZapA
LSKRKDSAKQGEVMKAKKSKVIVEILGETYPVKGDVAPERILAIATWLSSRMEQTAMANSRLSPTRVAVLTALNIAEEYMRLEEDYKQLLEMLKAQK